MKLMLVVISFFALMLIGWWYIKVNVKGFGLLWTGHLAGGALVA